MLAGLYPPHNDSIRPNEKEGRWVFDWIEGGFRDRHDRDEEPNSKDEESDPVDPEVYLVDSVD